MRKCDYIGRWMLYNYSCIFSIYVYITRVCITCTIPTPRKPFDAMQHHWMQWQLGSMYKCMHTLQCAMACIAACHCWLLWFCSLCICCFFLYAIAQLPLYLFHNYSHWVWSTRTSCVHRIENRAIQFSMTLDRQQLTKAVLKPLIWSLIFLHFSFVPIFKIYFLIKKKNPLIVVFWLSWFSLCIFNLVSYRVTYNVD